MSDETSLLQWAVGGLAAAGWGVFMYMNSRINGISDKQKDGSVEDAKLGTRISELRTHVSENYASKTDIQHSLANIHGRIDEMAETMKAGFEETRDDIKELLKHKS